MGTPSIGDLEWLVRTLSSKTNLSLSLLYPAAQSSKFIPGSSGIYSLSCSAPERVDLWGQLPWSISRLLLSHPGVVGVCLSGYLIETTGSWICVFNLVAIISNLGLCTFLVFGKAQRVDLSPTREDL